VRHRGIRAEHWLAPDVPIVLLCEVVTVARQPAGPEGPQGPGEDLGVFLLLVHVPSYFAAAFRNRCTIADLPQSSARSTYSSNAVVWVSLSDPVGTGSSTFGKTASFRNAAQVASPFPTIPPFLPPETWPQLSNTEAVVTSEADYIRRRQPRKDSGDPPHVAAVPLDGEDNGPDLLGLR